MTFSVLIANYNNAPYIEECLLSVFAQTYTKWEIVIVDDDSTDNSIQVLQKYSDDPRIKIYQNESNKGCGYTKRRCVKEAEGEVCGFLDPDDVLHEKALETMAQSHSEFPEVGLIYSTYYGCDESLNKEFIPSWVGKFKEGETQLEASRISAFATFKKSEYEKTKGVNPKLERAVDQDLYFKLEEVTETKFIDNPLYYYRKHDKGISTFENSQKAQYWHLMAGLDACERRGLSKEEFFEFFMHKQNKPLLKKIYSPEYRLGKMLLKPIRKIYSFFK